MGRMFHLKLNAFLALSHAAAVGFAAVIAIGGALWAIIALAVGRRP